jgi:5-methylcytosine-specific restriction enzyme A
MPINHGSQWWRRVSAAQLRAFPLCLCCKSIGRVIVAVLADHIIPISQGGKWQGPLQSACKRCHDVVKRELEALYAKGKCTEADLKLDSNLAQKLALKEYTRIGEDGWPTTDMLP